MGPEAAFEVGLDRPEPLLADIRRVADDGVEAAAGEDLGELLGPAEGSGIDRGVIDDAVARPDVGGEVGQRLPLRAVRIQSESWAISTDSGERSTP